MKRDLKCSVSGCDSRRTAKGFCGKHYTRWKAHGDPLAIVQRRAPHLSGPAELARILALPPTSDCIEWPFSRNSANYGRVWIEGKSHQTHRIVCERVHGPAPSSDHEVAHACRNPPCCNPAHIRWATRVENAQDRVGHGTSLRAMSHPGAKLSDEQALYIINNPEGLSQNALARRFAVSQTLVSYIQRGRVRRWLREPASA